MAKRAFGNVNWTPTATADTTNLADGTYQALGGGSATQRIEVIEVYAAGMAGASSPTYLMLCRDSQVGGTTALVAPAFDGPLDPSTAALTAAPIAYTVHTTTFPQRSVLTTVPRLNLGLNAFGGIVRWVAAPREEFIIYGSAANAGEASLSAYTGGTAGAINTHVIYEPL